MVQAVMTTFPSASSMPCGARATTRPWSAGLAGASRTPPAAEEYPADDDIPESDF